VNLKQISIWALFGNQNPKWPFSGFFIILALGARQLKKFFLRVQNRYSFSHLWGIISKSLSPWVLTNWKNYDCKKLAYRSFGRFFKNFFPTNENIFFLLGVCCLKNFFEEKILYVVRTFHINFRSLTHIPLIISHMGFGSNRLRCTVVEICVFLHNFQKLYIPTSKRSWEIVRISHKS